MGLLPPGSGKALALDTPIPTPRGWKEIGQLKVGDQVFGADGKPCQVTWVSPIWKNRPVYAVTTDTGDRVVADAEHEWPVILSREPNYRKEKLKTSKQLAKPRGKRPLINHAQALELPEQNLILDPYVLGVWLGDGSTLFPTISCGNKDSDWLCSELRRLGVELSISKRGENFNITLLNTRKYFRELGMMGGSCGARAKTKLWGKKFIPQIYLRASVLQRLALLQGLIDTDGYVAPSGMVEFSNTNRELAYGVAELVRSLGAKASIVERNITLKGKDCGLGWRVYFYLKDAARMPRKASLTRNNERTPGIYINSEHCGVADTVCIEVDSVDHLFLCGKSMIPTHNSIYTSVVFPTHYMGRFRSSSIIVASYGSELPRKFGRRARSMVQQPLYQRIFNTNLSEESKAADEWALSNGSEWMAAGILTGITGNRADGVIWDDLIKGREQADSEIIRQKTWDAYVDDLLTRKKPKAFEIGVTCMVGDTQVLMCDGTHKNLRDIKRGDQVATYYEGKVVVSKVLNWRNCGPDNVFTIKTSSGKLVTANSRHPFLVERKGSTQWVRLKNLNVGDRVLRVSGGSGKTSNVKNVTNQQNAAVFATNIMGNGDGERASDLPRTITGRFAMGICGTATALTAMIMKKCSRLKKGFVQFAKELQAATIQSTGEETCASTIAMTQERCGGFSAIPATTWLEKELPPVYCKQQSSIYEITHDAITSIESAGYEDVFDVQIEHTENFIANSFVSHNTRWHEDDVAGRILPENYNGESGLIKCRDGNDWYVVCLPAECERKDDILGREIGEILWPEWFNKEMFAPFKRNPRTWSSLYQQRPAPDTGVLFKGEWFKPYIMDAKSDMPEGMEPGDLNIYGASDYAVTQEGDYTVHIVVGLDNRNNIYVLDLWRGQETSDVWIDKFCDLCKKWKPIGWAEEKGQIKSAIGPYLTKRMREREVYVTRAPFPSTKSKRMRAQSIIGRMAQRGLYVPVDAPWYSEFRRELLLFDAGRNDDQVDALGLIGQVLDKMIGADKSSALEGPPKVLSTDPAMCTITLDDLFEDNERRKGTGNLRIN